MGNFMHSAMHNFAEQHVPTYLLSEVYKSREKDKTNSHTLDSRSETTS